MPKGRTPKSELYKGHIRAAENIIADRLPQYLDNLHELAGGVWVEETDKDGKRKIYKEKPCRQSNEYLVNRIMGKPTEAIEVSGPEGDGLKVIVEYEGSSPSDDSASPGPVESPE